jgi:phage terminase large subunit-like protein
MTSTPKPNAFIRKLLKTAGVVVTRGTTYDNRANLAPTFFDQIIREYEGSRLGRQELLAEVLTDNPEALWPPSTIDQYRVDVAPSLDRIVVAIDPAASSNGDETGIIVAGCTSGGHFYVLDDRSLRGSPDAWARAAINAYHAYQADRIVAEANQGGEMVSTTLRTVDATVPVKLVHATRGKATRAEPVAALYEQGRGHHVGIFAALEAQMTDWTPGQPSPDRMDALVWAATELIVGRSQGAIPLAISGTYTPEPEPDSDESPPWPSSTGLVTDFLRRLREGYQ